MKFIFFFIFSNIIACKSNFHKYNIKQNKRLLCFMTKPSIKNYEYPNCVNCKFYKAEYFSPYNSDTNKCLMFGEKNINDGTIKYEFAELCRMDENKCGIKGKLYVYEYNMDKRTSHFLVYNLPFFMVIMSIIYFYNIL